MPPGRGRVGGVVAVQQIEDDPADLRLPGPDPDPSARDRHPEAQQAAVRLADRADRQLVRVVVRVERLLAAVGGDDLAEVALLVEQPHTDHRHAEVARRLEQVAGDVAEPAGVNRQGLAQRELHAEVGHGPQRRVGTGALEPRR
jgi:hypothetical protein